VLRTLRLKEEDGNVLVTATMLVIAMMMIGVAALSTVDTQSRHSGGERVRESTFNLVEGALSSQTYVLGRLGTGTSDVPFPNRCTPTATSSLCPEATNLARTYSNTTQSDYASGALVWETMVRDNTTGNFFEQSLLGDCTTSTTDTIECYDKNADKQLWVYSTATVRKYKREIVALVQVEERPVSFPRMAVAGGWFETSNNGNKVIVNTGSSLGLGVRCSGAVGSSNCLEYSSSKGQVSPENILRLNADSAISADDLNDLEDFAKSKGTWYAGCPSNPNGAVVFVENNAGATCSYNNSSPAAPGATKCCNTAAKPGLYILKKGKFFLDGNLEFYGLIYHPNLPAPGSSGVLVETGGTAAVYGGVSIDGPGGMSAGSSGANVVYDPTAFDLISAAGTAGVVQNTWREIPAD
jgi:type II secretory pathway pseudopilin PulG